MYQIIGRGHGFGVDLKIVVANSFIKVILPLFHRMVCRCFCINHSIPFYMRICASLIPGISIGIIDV